jgi:hypothetical protein
METPSQFGEDISDRRTVREADTCGGNRTAKKPMAAAERQQESRST